MAAAKALDFDHELARWVVAGPPLVAGALMALDALRRWRSYEDAMNAGGPLPAGRGLGVLGVGLAVYGVAALVATMLD